MPIDQNLVETMLSVLAKRYRAARAYSKKYGGGIDFPAVVKRVLDEHSVGNPGREEYFRELCRRGGQASGRARRLIAAKKDGFLDAQREYFTSREYIEDIAAGRAPDDPERFSREDAREALARDAD